MNIERISKPAAVALLLVVSLLAACKDLIADPSFDRWCGEMLCDWELDAGRIEQVPSWHRRDHAVLLVESPTQISQLSEEDPIECIRFELIVDADASAELSLELDFNDDGVDFERPIPEAHWEQVALTIHAPASYDKLRFIVHKRGEGRAVVAQLRAQPAEDCAGPRIEPRQQLPGARCGDEDCSLCADATCD